MKNFRLWQIFPAFKFCFKRCCKANEEDSKKIEAALVEEYTEQNDHMDKIINEYGKPFEGGTLAEIIATDVAVDDKSTVKSFKLNAFLNGGEGGHDPFFELGFGFTAYLDMLSKFSQLFCFFTILMIPVMGLYVQEGALKDYKNYSKAKYSLGNFGFSEAVCI
eukprot:CAMPEP_0176383460 /NCGR_PEP_ID=MMETSP0126-20121128/33526_1 /TAXON_ID=141414 ORGANISM="Strombidinopsis acuminatum, Strain SPMC142" /NCGR_SAMPLE_ID=MMETSP0126 /ASSEMBLY_ACC=CAM_ASM_000229 /LENGTH=162 /DNA_ID=CAMNT_0017748551 /DNA_START=165 /DNA_END=653 /DNA_ORIENTATION=-